MATINERVAVLESQMEDARANQQRVDARQTEVSSAMVDVTTALAKMNVSDDAQERRLNALEQWRAEPPPEPVAATPSRTDRYTVYGTASTVIAAIIYKIVEIIGG